MANHLGRKEKEDGDREEAVSPRSTCAAPKLTRKEERTVGTQRDLDRYEGEVE